MCSSFFTPAVFFVPVLKKYISQSTQVRGGHACRVLFHLVAVSWLALGCTLLAEVQDMEFSSPRRAMRQDRTPARLILAVCFKDWREITPHGRYSTAGKSRCERQMADSLRACPRAVNQRMALCWEWVGEGGGET